MNPLHCQLNNKIDFKRCDIVSLFKLEFINNGGYWSKIYNCFTLNEAKEMLLEEYPDAIYKRCKKV